MLLAQHPVWLVIVKHNVFSVHLGAQVLYKGSVSIVHQRTVLHVHRMLIFAQNVLKEAQIHQDNASHAIAVDVLHAKIAIVFVQNVHQEAQIHQDNVWYAIVQDVSNAKTVIQYVPNVKLKVIIWMERYANLVQVIVKNVTLQVVLYVKVTMVNQE